MPSNTWQLRRARQVINQGGIIAYPTEGVYGLGCDPLNEAAIERLFAIKHRPSDRGLIVIATDMAQLTPYIEPLSAPMRQRIEPTWPGPVTWILPAKPGTPDWLTGGRPTIAARISAHPLVRALCAACGQALVSTSANISGRPPARTGVGVRCQVGAQVSLVLDGALGGRRRPTEIRDAQSGQVLRAG